MNNAMTNDNESDIIGAATIFGPDKTRLTDPDKPRPKADDLFVKLPVWVNRSGLWSVMKHSEKAVYVVLVDRAGFVTRVGRTGNAAISRESGVNRKTVSAIIKSLGRYGLIKTWRKGWPRYYKILEQKPDDIEQMVSFLRPDKCPRNTDTYPRGSRGQFKKGTICP